MQDSQTKRFELVKQDIVEVFLNSMNHFIALIIYGNIQKLKSIPEIVTLQKQLLTTFSTQDIFNKIALDCVHQNNLGGLQYLIIDCNKPELCHFSGPDKITLLIEACTYGHDKIAEFLLVHKSNANTKDINGLTALHRVAQMDNYPEMILLLKRFGANPDILDNQGLAPIHIAALHGNSKVITALRNCGAKVKLKTRDGQDYLTIIRMKQSGQLSVRSTSLPNWTNDETKRSRANVSCISGFLLPKCNQQIFQDYIKNILDFDRQLDLLETIFLLNSYFLTSCPTAEKLIQTSDNLVKLKKLLSLDTAPLLQRLGNYFLQMGNIESAKMLILNSFELINKEPKENVDIGIYSESTYNALHIGLYAEALELGKTGLSKKVENGYQINALANLHYNLGMVCRKVSYLEKAIKHFESAYLLNKNDKENFIEYMKSLLPFKEYNKIKEVCYKSSHKELSEIFLIEIDIRTGNINEITALSKYKETYSDEHAYVIALDRKSYLLNLVGNSAQALSYAEQSYAIKLKLSKRFDELSSILRALLTQYLHCGEYTKALSFSNEIKEKYPAHFTFNEELRCLIIGTYITNGQYEEARSLMTETKIIETSQTLLGEVLHNFVITKLTGPFKNLDERLRLLNNVLAILPQCKSLVQCRIIEYLLQNKEPLDSDVSLLNIDISILKWMFKKELPTLISPENAVTDTHLADTQDTAESLDSYDPVKIHEFYQNQKKLAQQALASHLCDLTRTSRWIIKSTPYDSDNPQMILLDNLFFPNHWAIISEGLQLDAPILKQLQLALQNGICLREKNQSGIKCLEGKIFELKIHADLRLWTSCVYRNPNGQCLIVFDKTANHEEINRLLLRTKSLTVIEVPDQAKPVSAVTSSSFYSPAPAPAPAPAPTATTTSGATTLTSAATQNLASTPPAAAP